MPGPSIRPPSWVTNSLCSMLVMFSLMVVVVVVFRPRRWTRGSWQSMHARHVAATAAEPLGAWGSHVGVRGREVFLGGSFSASGPTPSSRCPIQAPRPVQFPKVWSPDDYDQQVVFGEIPRGQQSPRGSTIPVPSVPNANGVVVDVRDDVVSLQQQAWDREHNILNELDWLQGPDPGSESD